MSIMAFWLAGAFRKFSSRSRAEMPDAPHF